MILDGFGNTRIITTDWYYIDEVIGTECTLGDCKKRAYFEVGAPFGNISAIPVCYMHILDAIGDTIGACRIAAAKTRPWVVRKLRRLARHELKKGYEYGARFD